MPVTTTIDNGVHLIIFDEGENRLNLTSVRSVAGALADVADPGGPVVITGAGKFFCNGLDLEWMESASGDDVGVFFTELSALLGAFMSHPGAVVAALNGHTFGAGAVLAAAADLRVQREDRGYFCFPEVDLGMSLSAEFDAVVRAKFPTQAVLTGLLTGRRYGGPDALAAGFVDQIASDGEVLAEAQALAATFATKDPGTVAAIKRRQHAAALAVLPAVEPAGT